MLACSLTARGSHVHAEAHTGRLDVKVLPGGQGQSADCDPFLLLVPAARRHILTATPLHKHPQDVARELRYDDEVLPGGPAQIIDPTRVQPRAPSPAPLRAAPASSGMTIIAHPATRVGDRSAERLMRGSTGVEVLGVLGVNGRHDGHRSRQRARGTGLRSGCCAAVQVWG